MAVSYLTVFKETLIWDVVTYPFQYASFLVQIGYRPDGPVVVSNVFLRKSFCFSSVTSTVGHIYMTDGLFGCYSGLRPFVCSQFISKAIIRLYYDKFLPYEIPVRNKTNSLLSSSAPSSSSIVEIDSQSHRPAGVGKWKPICFQAVIDLLSRLTAITVSHPLTIVSYRVMAQFVGREQKYTGICSSLCTIYREQGICGFFVGLAPQLIRQMISFVSLSVLLYILNNYTNRNRRSLHELSYNIADVAIKSLTYPLHIVSICTAVNDYGLKAVSPPLMPHFEGDWLGCWNYMSRTGQLKLAWFPFHRYSQKMPAKTIQWTFEELD